ncbi:hypothetical protein DL98DRAFT_600687 [Cadophora sp. DSE1049]|nr:hypothetical protein DL98DRAFT_600687 [Cadophora sp. DSE1049]
MSKYYPGVKVIWNEKAYANSSNLIDWIKHDYSHVSEYPLSNHEPRLLVLDAFASYKHTGKKVGEAWRRIYTDYRETIIKTFKNLGLSLNLDGSEDSELKIRDLPNITIGDYTSSSTNPTFIDDDDELEGDTIVVQGTYIGVEETYTIPIKNENDVTTDTGNDIESAFDSDSEFDSSEEEEGDMDIANTEGE